MSYLLNFSLSKSDYLFSRNHKKFPQIILNVSTQKRFSDLHEKGSRWWKPVKSKIISTPKGCLSRLSLSKSDQRFLKCDWCEAEIWKTARSGNICTSLGRSYSPVWNFFFSFFFSHYLENGWFYLGNLWKLKEAWSLGFLSNFSLSKSDNPFSRKSKKFPNLF